MRCVGRCVTGGRSVEGAGRVCGDGDGDRDVGCGDVECGVSCGCGFVVVGERGFAFVRAECGAHASCRVSAVV